MKSKKLKIENLKVKSFITEDLKDESQTIKGGYVTHDCTAGWSGCPVGGGGGGGTYASCKPNTWHTHRPCDTAEPVHCSPCD
ncbi:pinensin family lanthipeptide [Fulvivirga sediminis]|uniref:Pinensin family lanthipeptide n=1 Tax=Fulvivirga sediminis TaxID=2803949 RepID=A0A937K1S8_9BACT|nr:pinensin family lanthipeptide [Fulvivirga sediminis]MBL3657012.1 pinensin family lanthipeptide [Fulvivirga sediminis]